MSIADLRQIGSYQPTYIAPDDPDVIASVHRMRTLLNDLNQQTRRLEAVLAPDDTLIDRLIDLDQQRADLTDQIADLTRGI